MSGKIQVIHWIYVREGLAATVHLRHLPVLQYPQNRSFDIQGVMVDARAESLQLWIKSILQRPHDFIMGLNKNRLRENVQPIFMGR